MNQSPITIAIVDDHVMIVQGFQALLSASDDIRIAGTAQHGRELQTLMEKVIPQVVLLDVSMPVMDGKETLLWLKKEHPEVKVLVLTVATQISVIKSMLRLGADGYLLKESGIGDLREAIQTVAGGEHYQDRKVTQILLEDLKGQETNPNEHFFELTRRELELAQHFAQSMKSVEVAETLFISVQTVLTHRRNMLSKAKSYLGIKNMNGLIAWLINKGWIDPPSPTA